MKYQIWIKGRKDKTLQIIEVPPYKDGSTPTMLKIRSTACKSSHFDYNDYTKIKYKRIPTKEDP